MDLEKQLKDRFDKELGVSMVFQSDDIPVYVICYDHSHHVALINMKKFPRELTFEKFSLGALQENGYAIRGRFGFNFWYLNAAKKILTPNEYAVENRKNLKIDEVKGLIEDLGVKDTIPYKYQDILYLKKGSYCIAIAPRIFKRLLKTNETKLENYSVCDFSKIVKKTASSAAVW